MRGTGLKGYRQYWGFAGKEGRKEAAGRDVESGENLSLGREKLQHVRI